MMGGGQGGQQRGGGSAGPAAAWLSTLVFEALDKVASPEARNELIKAALGKAGLSSLPAEPDELLAFAVGSLRDAVAEGLGDEAGEALVHDLEPILQQAVASIAPPPGEAADSARASAERPPPSSKRHTLPMGGQRAAAERSNAPSSAPAAAQSQAELPRRQRGTFPYVERVLRQENARHVVLIDDFRAFLGGFPGVLRARGFEVFTAPDGAAALALCRRLEPEFVVLDLAMPDVDAAKLLRKLEDALGARAPVVAMLVHPGSVAAFDSPLGRTFSKGTRPDALVDALEQSKAHQAE